MIISELLYKIVFLQNIAYSYAVTCTEEKSTRVTSVRAMYFASAELNRESSDLVRGTITSGAHRDHIGNTYHRQNASQTTTIHQGAEDVPSASLSTRCAIPISFPPPTIAPSIHPLLPFRHQGSLQPPHSPRSRSQLRQGQNIRERSQGSEAAWKSALRLPGWSDSGNRGTWRAR
jgi:hypothetical protein